MKFTFKWLLLVGILSMLFSCASKEDILLFQDIENLAQYSEAQRNNPTIREDDMLIITVSAPDLEAVRPYNLMIETRASNLGRGVNMNLSSSTQQEPYLVDADGNIEFPVLGTIHVAGKSRSELIAELRDRISQDVKNPIVNLRIVNFKVTVLGEVARPGTYSVSGERITIPEALGLAGDLTIYGKRQDIIILREIDGKKEHRIIDLTSIAALQSDYYYLQQNDVIYVQPNGAQIQSSKFNRNASVYVSVASLLISVLVLIFK